MENTLQLGSISNTQELNRAKNQVTLAGQFYEKQADLKMKIKNL